MFNVKLKITIPVLRDVDECKCLLKTLPVKWLLGLFTRGKVAGAWRLPPTPI
jgi:hypothetical protein